MDAVRQCIAADNDKLHLFKVGRYISTPSLY